MRIWSLHPKYLDSKGLVALWRETLLAKNVLEENTKGYKNHPQLERFKNAKNPIGAINQYLSFVFDEAQKRKFTFDEKKFEKSKSKIRLTVTKGQMDYEFKHLLNKLITRDYNLYLKFENTKMITPHPLFEIIEGEIENWEIVK